MKPDKVRETVLWLLGEMDSTGLDDDDHDDGNQGTLPPFICGDVDPKVFPCSFFQLADAF
jgi:hypothetical protein